MWCGDDATITDLVASATRPGFAYVQVRDRDPAADARASTGIYRTVDSKQKRSKDMHTAHTVIGY